MVIIIACADRMVTNYVEYTPATIKKVKYANGEKIQFIKGTIKSFNYDDERDHDEDLIKNGKSISIPPHIKQDTIVVPFPIKEVEVSLDFEVVPTKMIYVDGKQRHACELKVKEIIKKVINNEPKKETNRRK